jgi:hypothetical protein
MRSAGEREIVPGESVPAVGDVLSLTPLWSERVERVRGRSVWLVPVDGVSLGAERWMVLPPARRRGPERLKRRRG